MNEDDPFFVLHHGLDREGPGAPEDVAWTIETLGLSGKVRICDAGCGPGADSEAFADRLSVARIEAVDLFVPFVAQAKERLARFGDRVIARQGDMAAIEGPYDLIWCAGAIYFVGVTEGLSAWRASLAAGGYVAFSEPVWLGGSPSDSAQEFWREYPAITDMQGLAARVDTAGYRIANTRIIQGTPWERYYVPMEARIEALRQSGPSEELASVLDEHERETALWRKARSEIAYALLLVTPR